MSLLGYYGHLKRAEKLGKRPDINIKKNLIVIVTFTFALSTTLLAISNYKLRQQTKKESPTSTKKVKTNVNKKQETNPQVEKRKQAELEVDNGIFQLNLFKEDFSDQLEEISSKMNGELMRRATVVTNDAWLVETLIESPNTRYKPDLSDTRSTVENRNHYYVTKDQVIKINTEPLICYVEGVIFISHEFNIPTDTPLTEDMFLVYGPCYIDSFVSLHKLVSGEKVPLSDPDNLIKQNENSRTKWLIPQMITQEGNAGGKLLGELTFGKEPVFIVEYGGGEINPPKGMGVFSARTGRLLDLVLYESF